jgi:quercetin dioxygenase-like cupin family protein
MHQYTFPHTITNKSGESLTFVGIVRQDGKEVMLVENSVAPGCGPPMHVHFKQAESLTVTEGELTYQIAGQPPVVCRVGQTVLFHSGVPHKFWNSGSTPLRCTGWVSPANRLDFFLTEMYRSMDEGDGKRPELFSSAYLTWRYRSEYGMLELPAFVRHIILPFTYFIGVLTGKYTRFKEAPEPI